MPMPTKAMDFGLLKIAIGLFLLAWIKGHHCSRPDREPLPNIIVILMDDQDWVLGGMEPLAKTRSFVDQHNGTVFANAFVSTPVCCPSRSSILTGKYVHNHGVINNTVTGNCCSSQWQNGPEKKTMATYLQSKGYRTFYGGKYLNQYGKNITGGVERVPPGYNRWVGLVGNSRYYNYTLSIDGEARHHADDYRVDYLTDVIAKEALDFMGSERDDRRPFFALIAPPACHSPFEPAARHAGRFAARTAPRWPSFGRKAEPGQKHWLMRQGLDASLGRDVVDRIDHVFRQRWRTLLAVDDMVENMVTLLKTSGRLEETYFVFTSDHGYHMGQFGMPIDKRLPYDTDIRVPLIIVPPTLVNNAFIRDAKGRSGGGGDRLSRTVHPLAVVSVDLAPTVLDMARIERPVDMDGVSLLAHLAEQGRGKVLDDEKSWRTRFLVEYHGEADLEDVDPACRQDPMTTLCLEDFDCRCQDSANNTYVCLRTLTMQREHGEDSVYCVFDDGENFVEYYDLNADPFQMNNTAACRSPSDDGERCQLTSNVPHRLPVEPTSCVDHEKYLKLLADITRCRGISCFG